MSQTSLPKSEYQCCLPGKGSCVDGFDKEISGIFLPAHNFEVIKWVDYIPQTMFWRRRVWDDLGGLDTSFRYAMDWDFFLRR